MARSDVNPREPQRPSSAGTLPSTPGMVDKAQDTASRLVETVQDTAAPIVDAAGEKAGQVTEQAKDQMTSRLDVGRELAVESLSGVAQALRQTGQHLREEGSQPTLGQYADTGAQQLERFTGYLREHDTSQLLSEVEAFARRRPTLFAGGAFALGLLAARFFRSSGQRQQATPMRAGPPYGVSYGVTIPRMPSSPPVPASSPTPRPAAGEPPSSTSTAPAARSFPPSPEWTPPTPERSSPSAGAGPDENAAEQRTPSSGAGSTPEQGPMGGASPSSERPGSSGRPHV